MTTSNPNPNPNPTTERAGQAWQDTTLPYATRVDLLLAQMTVEEKVGQLGSRWIGNDMRDAGNADAPADVAPMQKVFAGAGALVWMSRHRRSSRPTPAPRPSSVQRRRIVYKNRA